MGVQWQGVYRPRTSGVHTRRSTQEPLTAWATDQISGFYDRTLEFFREEQPRARQAVQDRSRIDTGRMRSEADAYLSHTLKLIELEFGWDDNRPHYARFQEFGTRRGITPMLAVGETFEEAVARLQHELNG